MSTSTVLLSFLSGGAVGSVATALVTVSHARTERFRELRLEAAERFLTKRDEAVEANWQYQRAATELLDARNDVIAWSETASEKVAAFDADLVALGREHDPVPEPFTRAFRALRALEPEGALANPLRADIREAVKAEVERANAAVHEVLENEDEPLLEDMKEVLRGAISGQVRFLAALQSFGDAGQASVNRLGELQAIVARLTILFEESREKKSQVVAEAKSVAEAVVAAHEAVLAATGRHERALTYQPIGERIRESNDAALRFAAAVNARIRRRWRI